MIVYAVVDDALSRDSDRTTRTTGDRRAAWPSRLSERDDEVRRDDGSRSSSDQLPGRRFER